MQLFTHLFIMLGCVLSDFFYTNTWMNESLSDFGTAPKRGSPADKSIRRVRLPSLCNEDGAAGAQTLSVDRSANAILLKYEIINQGHSSKYTTNSQILCRPLPIFLLHFA